MVITCLIVRQCARVTIVICKLLTSTLTRTPIPLSGQQHRSHWCYSAANLNERSGPGSKKAFENMHNWYIKLQQTFTKKTNAEKYLSQLNTGLLNGQRNHLKAVLQTRCSKFLPCIPKVPSLSHSELDCSPAERAWKLMNRCWAVCMFL